jgi:hypothetical protein
VRNYYRESADPFSPMVFFGKEYWTETLPAVALLESLFTKNKRGSDYKANVLVTDDEDQAVEFLVRKAPPDDTHLDRLRKRGMLS